MAIDKTKKTQILVTFPNELLEEIETYWHDKRIRNRNTAIIRLIEKSLEKDRPKEDT